ncbi:MAG: class I SAM-dependent methyltransferase [Myxococcota bacterium]
MPWSDSDTLWAELEPVLFPPSRVAAAGGEVDALVKLAGLAPGARVLDLPCGVGRHTIALSERGFRVTGADRTPLYVRRARERAPELDWRVADMRDFTTDEPYDAVLNLWTAFGYFDTPGDDLRVLGRFHAALRPGGALVMDLNGKETLARTFRPRDWYPVEGGGWLLEDRKVRDDWTWVDSAWTYIRPDGRVIEHGISVRLYAASELRALLHEAGFAEVKCFGALDGVPYDENARRLVVIARR